jgi:DNA-binding SARP family transcriptional activator
VRDGCYNPRQMLEFRILGPLEVRDGDEPVPLGGLKQRALLAILLLRAGRVVSTDTLVDELWGEQPPRTATTSLQNFVSQLRKALGPEVLVTRPPGYVLEINGSGLDLRRFEEAVRAARGADARQRAGLLRGALDLWHGSALAEFAYEPFAQNEIGRLEQLRLSVLEDRIDADLELGRHDALVGELEALVREHPTSERLRGQLMLALYRAGRQADALGAYRDARRALTEELGIEPTPALQQLHNAILRQDPAVDPPGSQRSRAATADDAAVEAARALLAGRLVLVLGSALEDETAATAALADRLADLFSCPPDEPRELARIAQYVAMTRGLGPLRDELESLLSAPGLPRPVHAAVAALPAALRGRDAPPPVIATSNYHPALEDALDAHGERYDVLAYVAAGRDRGRFLHVSADGTETVVAVPNAYAALPLDSRPVVLKLHGGPRAEGVAVSEDDFIAYLAQTEITNVVPVTLAARLRRSHFLFLGYGLREWSLRVFLQRIWPDERVAYRSWAVLPGADGVDRDFWRARGVDVVDEPLADFAGRLATLVREGAQ